MIISHHFRLERKKERKKATAIDKHFHRHDETIFYSMAMEPLDALSAPSQPSNLCSGRKG
jgi:hypothetical protein